MSESNIIINMICAEVSIEYFCHFCTDMQKEKEILNLDESLNIFIDLLDSRNIVYDEDIFIIPTEETLLIGNTLDSFNESKSLKRMKIDIFDILESVDLIFDEPFEIVQLKTFLMKDITYG